MKRIGAGGHEWGTGGRITDNDRVNPRDLAAAIGTGVCIAAVVASAQTSPANNEPVTRAIAEVAAMFAAETSTDQLWTLT